MKRLIVILFLTGCYSDKDDCYHGMTTICNGEVYPSIARYQKPYSLGKTNPLQRWVDIESCNGYRSNKNSNDVKVKGARDKSGKLVLPIVYAFQNCMKSRGYIFIEDCGRKNSKTDKGICNE